MEIWGGGGGSLHLVVKLIEKGIYLLKDVKQEDVAHYLPVLNFIMVFLL